MASPRNPFAQWEQHFVGQVQRLREARGMTQTDLARELQQYGLRFHQQTVQRIESGERPVRLDEAYLIARVFDTTVETMTSTDAPSVQELRYAVDRVRRRSDQVAEDLSELLSDWMQNLEELAYVVDQGMTSTKTEDLSAASKWGMAFAFKAHEATTTAMDAWHKFGELAGRDEDELMWAEGVVEQVGGWIEAHGSVIQDSMEPSDWLYRSLEASDDE